MGRVVEGMEAGWILGLKEVGLENGSTRMV